MTAQPRLQPQVDAEPGFLSSLTEEAATTPRRVWHGWVLLAVLLLSACMGMRRLNADALWYDEHWSVYYAGMRHYAYDAPVLPQMWARVEENSTWTPAYFMLLAGWDALTGEHHVPARLLSALFGLLAVAWTYRLGADMASRQVGIGAAVALGAAALFADYMHEMRAYTLAALLTVTGVWGYWRSLTDTRLRWWTLMVFALSAAGLLWVHYFAALSLVAWGLYHVLFVKKNRRWWWLTGLGVGAGLSFLPYIGAVLTDLGSVTADTVRQSMALTATGVLRELAFTFSNGSVALLAVVGGLAVLSLRGVHGKAARFVWLWVIVTLVLSLLVNWQTEALIHIRYLLGLFPALALLVGLGVAEMARRGVSPAVVLVVWALAGVWQDVNPAFINDLHGARRKIPGTALAQVLDNLTVRGNPGDVVVFHVEEPGKEWLTERTLGYELHDLPQRHTQTESIPGVENDYVRAAQDFVDDAPFVWFATMPDVPSGERVMWFERALQEDGYAACGTVFDRDGMRLDLWARQPTEFTPFQRGAVDVSLLQADRSGRGRLWMVVGWQVEDSVPLQTYSVSVQVDGADGVVTAQDDHALPEPGFHCQIYEFRARYVEAVWAVVYNWRTGERMPGVEDGRGVGLIGAS